ncbi:MAG: hypothetical protein PHS62_01565 [Patescibacteria group bacterium]|nr:hypothetical protein [Patescibacteria group bacterium]
MDFTPKMVINPSDLANNQLLNQAIKPIWLSVSEAAKLGGVQTKTIRRAIQYNYVKYKIIGNRYLIDFPTLILYLHTKKKLKNKLNQFGLGQYVDKWKQ